VSRLGNCGFKWKNPPKPNFRTCPGKLGANWETTHSKTYEHQLTTTEYFFGVNFDALYANYNIYERNNNDVL